MKNVILTIIVLTWVSSMVAGVCIVRRQDIQLKEKCNAKCTNYLGVIDYTCATDCYEWETK